MKLRLQVAEDEVPPPSRPIFRPRVIRAASGPSVRSFLLHPERLLALIEEHVRTVTGVLLGNRVARGRPAEDGLFLRLNLIGTLSSR